MNIKKKHHFISQFYLKYWSTREKIIVWDGKKSFKAKSNTIAFKNHLYRISPLNISQVKLLEHYLESFKFNHLSTYKLIIKSIIEVQKAYEKFDILIEKSGASVPPRNSIDNLIEQAEFNSNIIEDKFSMDEDRFSRIIRKINTTNKPKISLNEYDSLIYFISTQLCRTSKKINNLLELNKDINPHRSDFTEEELYTFNLYISLCFTEALYLSLTSKLYKINICYNDSNINFITSDDPCFNQMYNEGKFYINLPISPKISIEICENNLTDSNKNELIKYYVYHKLNADSIFVNEVLVNFRNITENEVTNLNDKIFLERQRFIYAKNHDELKLIHQ